MNTPNTRALVDALRIGKSPVVSGDEAIDWKYVVEELGDGPLAADLFQCICAVPMPSAASKAAEILIDRLHDPGAAQEIVALVCGGLAIPEAVAEITFSTFRRSAFTTQKHYGTRAAALKGALYLAQGHAARIHWLQGDLLAVSLTDDPQFLRHAAAVAGVVASQRPDQAFVDLLQAFYSVHEAADEAAFGLGLVLLAQALGSRERPEALALFQDSRHWFRNASINSEDRADAGLFFATVGVLVDFANGTAIAEVQDGLKAVEQRLFDYLSIHLVEDHRPPDQSWIGLRTTEAAHWAALALKLTELAGSLARDAWLEGIRVIEEQLFHILSASRTIFRRATDGGIEAITGPTIQTAFIKEKSRLAMLDEWLASKARSPWYEQAKGFRGQVQTQLEGAITRQAFDAAGAPSTLAASATLEGPSATDRLELHEAIAGVEREFSLHDTDPIVEELLHSMIAKLSKNEDFRGQLPARNLFIQILLITLKFVAKCDNAQSGEAKYLFTEATDKPLEAAIEADYITAIRLSSLSRLCTRQPQEVGGGRADVQFAYKGYTLITECKRSFDDLTNTQALIQFGGQLVAYQVSSVTFSALLILDLFPRGGSMQQFRDRVSVEEAAPFGKLHSFAVFRVQGHRRSPSDLKLKDTLIVPS
ncbi:hypothetical protein [Bradyrhizobium forestalis]|nr:hypothetical protein [Bradyrhizobium forestalis]